MIDLKNIEKEFEVAISDLAKFMIDDLKGEIIDQGHVLTGTLRDSIEQTGIHAANGSIEAFVSLESYYGILDQGVKSNRIPYERGSGRKSSKYIDGLIKFWMIKKGLSHSEAKSAAFALANKHKKEGMPTQSSWQYSKNGRRLEFFTRTLDSNLNYDKFEETIQNQLEEVSNDILNVFEKSLK
ncbi:MAG: hypothetical protein ABI851_12135 [Saprospiraceae bacterium]